MPNVASLLSRLRERCRPTDTAAPWAIVLLALILSANLLALVRVGMHPDEAYYWVWSTRPDWGYFDHPPAVAWMIRAFTTLSGSEPWAVRLPSVLAWFVALVVVGRLAASAFESRRAGTLAMLVFASAPIFQVGFHIVTPDAPLLLFVALAYYFLWLAFTRGHGRYWLAAGACVGGALLGKYTGVLLPLAIFVALLADARARRWLATPWPWLAGTLALAMFLPVVLWNYHNDWISFRFQFGHGVQAGRGFSLQNLLVYMGSQMGVLLPWTWIAMVIAAVRSRRQFADKAAHTLFASGFAVPLVFFGIAGLTFPGGANWPAMAYVPGSILLGGMLARWLESPAWRRTGVALVITAVAVSMALVNLLRYPLGAIQRGITFLPDNTQITHTYGWPELGAALREVRSAHGLPAACHVMTDYHLLSAVVAYQLRDGRIALPLPQHRVKQYGIWDAVDQVSPGNVCMVVQEGSGEEGLPAVIGIPDYGKWSRVRIVHIPAPERTRWYGLYIREDHDPR